MAIWKLKPLNGPWQTLVRPDGEIAGRLWHEDADFVLRAILAAELLCQQEDPEPAPEG